ncbi:MULTISPECIES: chloride channel protein [unclassified Streptomyces]|uniref:chloride channel protein n=1 Tax=unclassified Streptomyces TaxID=2593676 RepID=UPI002E299ECD|nr:chloride channel protein [Streptomyces sp. NBC_00223]
MLGSAQDGPDQTGSRGRGSSAEPERRGLRLSSRSATAGGGGRGAPAAGGGGRRWLPGRGASADGGGGRGASADGDRRWLPSGPAGGPGDTLPRWIVLALLIGAVAGLGAVALYELVHWGTEWLLGDIGGYRPYGTTAKGVLEHSHSSSRPWAVPLVAGAGALLASVLVVRFAPEASGHGTDAAIEAAHHRPLSMRAQVPFVKLVASALTIGAGGSGGTEGPAAQISASFGSIIARRARLTPGQARTAVVIGLAAGVGAVFRAPLGGALLGAELLYRRDADPAVLPKALLASAAGFVTFGACLGFGTFFGPHAVTSFGGLRGFLPLALVGLLAGAAGRLYAFCFYWVHEHVEPVARTTVRRLLFPTVGALMVGGLGLLVPGVLGTGYGLMQALTQRQVLLDLSPWVLVAVPLAKIVATSVSVGSGGSGGIFGPCLVVGAGVGAVVWRLFEPTGLVPHSPLACVVVGMAACLGPVARAPLAVLVMAVETVGDASLLAPGIVGVLCASVVVGRTTLYRSQVERRGDGPVLDGGALLEVADGGSAGGPGTPPGAGGGRVVAAGPIVAAAHSIPAEAPEDVRPPQQRGTEPEDAR